jgi:hypothetical protein
MKMRYFFEVSLFIILSLSSPLLAETTYSDGQHYKRGILLVKIADISQKEATVKALFALGALEVEPLVHSSRKIPPSSPLLRWRKVRFSQDADLQKLVEDISANPLFEHVERDRAITLHSQ